MKQPKPPSPAPPKAPASIPVASNLPPKEVLDSLPENVRIALIESASFSGPLPPPSMFGEYDRVLPGSAERILRMAEREQAHRMNWETTALGGDIRQEQYGQWFGLLIAVLCIGSAVYLAMNGQTTVAGILAGTSALGLAGRFIQGKRDESQREEDK